MAESKKKTVSKDSEKSTKSATKSIKKVKAPVEKKITESRNMDTVGKNNNGLYPCGNTGTSA